MTARLPDPLTFTLASLEAEGALVEPDEALALLPPALAGALALPEEVQIGSAAAPCGFGTPLLEALVARTRAGIPVASARLDAAPARASIVRAQAGRYVVRNGVTELLETGEREERWLLLAVAWTAEADERREGLATLVVHAADGGAPEPGWLSDLDPRHLQDAPARPLGAETVAGYAARMAPLVVAPQVAPVLAATRRRHEREHGRLCAWYASLIAETKKPRRRLDPAAIAAKITHLETERGAKLAELAHRYQVRVRLAPAAALWVSAPAATARLKARRRKGERILELRLPAGASGFEALPCEGCARWAQHPALCDERLHVLCETCVPVAEGRARCPACLTESQAGSGKSRPATREGPGGPPEDGSGA